MLNFMTGDEIVDRTAKMISAKKQQAAFSLDLTVREIYRVNRGGALDFGGSEFQEASATLLKPEKKSPKEPYGWWRLGPGVYLMKFNEKIDLQNQGLVIVLPHSRLLASGASHSPVTVEVLDEDVQVPISIGLEGLSIKENARVSKAMVLAAGADD
ncbi:MAG TPA: hypothetical protein VMC85_09490 [Desulfomonilaceae bacterium]|nr:hypothetical protein [Desulfomonilaceae bacterium]